MGAPRKYSVELQERATRMAMEARREPESSRGAIKRIADQLGVHPEALRNWVRQAEIDGGVRPGTTTDDATRIAELEREGREIRRCLKRYTSRQIFPDPGIHAPRTADGRVNGLTRHRSILGSMESLHRSQRGSALIHRAGSCSAISTGR